MEIKLSLKPSKHWMEDVARQFGTEAKSPTEFFYTEGNSFIKLNATLFEREVLVLLGELCWFKPLNTLKESLSTNDYWTLSFVQSEDAHTHYLLDTKSGQKTQTHKSTVLYSSRMSIDTHWPVGKRSRFVVINFRRQWLFDKLGINLSNLTGCSPLISLLSSEVGVYLQGVSFFEQTVSLDKLFEGSSSFTWKLLAQAQCYKLIADFISQVGRNESDLQFIRINQSDLKQIEEIESRYFMASKPLPNLEFLASEANMSLSKFKKCFKQVYGMPPYEYHLNQKLEIAKNQLLQNKWTVSEIASNLGYTSAANFDKAFKKKFMVSPTKMLKEI
ncbi:helix-turn-helix domain-containing protein [Runella slithyformis]|uniref:Transcriptional regulator, AraC family n=1 Tax=Runella slithyformis (strain ATCC 29530 / DSM 19594 / LMG 11500 / NCIMB 11436 / LSU 4) TaxID=761193 RepID=A0A7U4E486_RUNSL|nr:AraC family transcriptional regulator [Runella slithyformis]AEI47034.1 transcriptional regulator, AraC family [Runella slithyformis DSM 19594]